MGPEGGGGSPGAGLLVPGALRDSEGTKFFSGGCTGEGSREAAQPRVTGRRALLQARFARHLSKDPQNPGVASGQSNRFWGLSGNMQTSKPPAL